MNLRNALDALTNWWRGSSPSSGADQTPGFREVLKSRGAYRKALDMINPGDLSDLPEEVVREIVEEYVHSQHQSRAYWQVMSLGKERTRPHMIEVVLRPGSESRPPGTEEETLYEPPVVRALQRLPEGELEELVPRLLELARSGDRNVRLTALQHLTAYGRAELVPAIVESAEESGDDYAASWIGFGLRTAMKEERASEEFRRGLYPYFAKVARVFSPGNSRDRPELLLQLDAEAAERDLMEIVLENSKLSADALSALLKHGTPVPAELLWKTLEAHDVPPEGEYWRHNLYETALRGLAKARDPRVQPVIDRLLAEPVAPEEFGMERYRNRRLQRREAASGARLLFLGADYESNWERYKAVGREGLLPAERPFYSRADGQISNGGFSQYYFNISYDPREDIADMELIGAREHAILLRRAMSAFGSAGPAADEDKRKRQLEKMKSREDDILEACNKAWFTSTESLHILLNEHYLRHREELREVLPETR
jgi:hypothetical protein